MKDIKEMVEKSMAKILEIEKKIEELNMELWETCKQSGIDPLDVGIKLRKKKPHLKAVK